jgi:HD-GYP domain-containing protein (c-di-GMP phosphodiesterase class II)
MWYPLKDLDGFNRLLIALEQELLAVLRTGADPVKLMESDLIQEIFSQVDSHPYQAWLFSRLKSSHTMTPRHGINVMLTTRAWAVTCHKLGDKLDSLSLAALFHDLGHWYPDDSLVFHFDFFSHEQMRQVRQHLPLDGDRLPLEPEALEWLNQHHEQPNGKGYPLGLTKIHPLGALLRIADCFDGLTTARRFRPAYSHIKAMTLLRRWAGKRVDAGLVKSFRRFVGEWPAGSFVRLKSGEGGVVLPGAYPRVHCLVLTNEQGDRLAEVECRDLMSEDIDGESRWHDHYIPDEWRGLRPDLAGLPRFYE